MLDLWLDPLPEAGLSHRRALRGRGRAKTWLGGLTMKAAVLKKLGQPFQIESVPEPVIGPDEVLVQTRTCGICRTDLHIQDGLAYVPACRTYQAMSRRA